MTSSDDEELRALRVRAYGRDADIHLDSEAFDRLRELEGGSSDQGTVDQGDIEVGDVEPVDGYVELDSERMSDQWMRRLSQLRRSTVLVALGLVVVATLIVVTLVLIQRVQDDPLQAGATQVARLSLDGSCQNSQFGVSPSGASAGSGSGFQLFHGLCTVVAPGGFLGERPGDPCLILYLAANELGQNSSSESAFVTGGCAAGTFPAMVQFGLNNENLPADLRSAFPDSSALQFVYDRAHEEVVVFAAE